MDDLNDKISRLLSSPDGMEKIRSVMASLGAPDAAPTAPAAAPAAVPAAGLPGTPPATPPASGLPDLTMIAKLAPMLGTLNKDNDDTRLLQALRPYLHGEREQRLDEAVQLLRLTRLLPLLQETDGRR